MSETEWRPDWFMRAEKRVEGMAAQLRLLTDEEATKRLIIMVEAAESQARSAALEAITSDKELADENARLRGLLKYHEDLAAGQPSLF